MAYNLGQQVYQILASVMEDDIAKRHFNSPVDAVQLGLADYDDVVKQPMDLGTIRSRLVQGYYRHPSEVYGDVHLVWHNCRSYNQPDSAVVAECNQLAAFFEGMWRKLDFGAQQQANGQAVQQQPGPYAEQLSFRRQLQQHLSDGREQAGPMSPQISQQQAALTRHKPPQAAAAGAAVAAAAAAGGGASALRSGHPLKRCLAVIEHLLQTPAAQPFRETDSATLGLMNGHVAMQPTDLATIRSRLAPGLENGWGTISYKATQEVLADVKAVFNTRRLFGITSADARACCDAAEREFARLWQEAGLPLDRPGSPPLSLCAPNSPTSLVSPGGSFTASLTAVGPGGAKGNKRLVSQRSMAELSSNDALHSADLSVAAAAVMAAVTAAPAKRQRKGGEKGKATATRCDVCVRSKKGRCGTDSAPKTCRKRVAKQAAQQQQAAQQAQQQEGGLALPTSGDLLPGHHEPSLGGAGSLDAAAYAAAAVGAAEEQHLLAERYANQAAAAAVAGAPAAAEGSMAAAGAGAGGALMAPASDAAAAGRPRRGGSRAGAPAAHHGQTQFMAPMLAPLGRGHSMRLGDGGADALGSPEAAAAAAGQQQQHGGKGARAAPKQAQGIPQRERELLASWARVQRKREAATEAAAAAEQATQAMLEAREVLEAVEQVEAEGEEAVLSETATPWPPGAACVPDNYDVAARNHRSFQRRIQPVLRLGDCWFAAEGPAAAAAAAAAAEAGKLEGGPSTSQRPHTIKTRPGQPCSLDHGGQPCCAQGPCGGNGRICQGDPLNGEADGEPSPAAAGTQQEQRGLLKAVSHGLRNGHGGVAGSGWSAKQLQQLRGRLASLIAREGVPGVLQQGGPDSGK